MNFRADFNNVADDGRLVKVSLRHALKENPAPPRPGDSASLFDSEGNACRGTVERVQGKIIFVRLVDSTWTPGERPRPVSSYASRCCISESP